jgi:hypothetical protein
MHALVGNYTALHRYRFAGHSALLGTHGNDWQEVDEVLAWFARKKEAARNARARDILCYWAVRELGMTATEVARNLTLKQPAVSTAVRRGEKMVESENLTLLPTYLMK